MFSNIRWFPPRSLHERHLIISRSLHVTVLYTVYTCFLKRAFSYPKRTFFFIPVSAFFFIFFFVFGGLLCHSSEFLLCHLLSVLLFFLRASSLSPLSSLLDNNLLFSVLFVTFKQSSSLQRCLSPRDNIVFLLVTTLSSSSLQHCLPPRYNIVFLLVTT